MQGLESGGINLINTGDTFMPKKMPNEELERKIKDLEEKVRLHKEGEKKCLTLLDNLECEAFMKDDSHRFVFMNKYMRDRYDENGLLGKSVHELVPKKDSDQIIEEDARVFSGETVHVTRIVKDKSGRKRTFRIVKFPFMQEGQTTLLGGIAHDITEYAQIGAETRKGADDLGKKAEKRVDELEKTIEKLNMDKMMLEESNVALRVLLKKRDEDRVEIEEKILFNVKELVKPYIEKTKETELTPKQNALLSVVQSNIDDIISPFVRDMSLKFMKLTPMEIQVANMIKQGRTTKQIAELMNLSGRTIETHRKKIRNKIGIGNKKANLRSHLLSLQ
jgi:PAS domain S-box-containing protein